jgi:flagellar assembly protein FliH
MASIIRSAIISDAAFVLSKEDENVIDNKNIADDYGELKNADVDEPVIVCDERELKLLEYARALEEAEEKIELLEKNNKSFQRDLDGLKKKASEEGYKNGFETGLKEGKVEANEKLAEQITKFDQLTVSYKKEMEKLISISEDALVEAAYAGVGKIIGDVVKEPNNWSDIIIHTVRNMGHTSHLQIRVSPEDYDYLSSLSDLNTEIGVDMETKIVPDKHVSIGGCILEHDGGTLDARLEVQFQRLYEALLNAREQGK